MCFVFGPVLLLLLFLCSLSIPLLLSLCFLLPLPLFLSSLHHFDISRWSHASLLFTFAVCSHRQDDNTDLCWHHINDGGCSSTICPPLTFHHFRSHHSVWREQPHGRDLAFYSCVTTNEVDYNANSGGLVWQMDRLWTLPRLSYKSCLKRKNLE